MTNWIKTKTKKWYCDGTADNVQLQAAIDSITSRGKVELSPNSSLTLADLVTIDNKRIFFEGNWSTLYAASGKYALKVCNAYLGSGNTHTFGRNLIIDGGSRAGSGINIDCYQGAKFENLRAQDCLVGVQLTSTVADQFSEGNAFEHTTFNGCSKGFQFIGGLGTGSFQDTTIRDCRMNLTTSGSKGFYFDAITYHCKPVTCNFQDVHVWTNYAGAIGLEVSDTSATKQTQLWHTNFINWHFEAYAANCYGMVFGNSTNVSQKMHFYPMPYFYESGGSWAARISNPNNYCLGDAVGTKNDSGYCVWTPDGTKIYRIYVSNTGVLTAVDVSSSYT
jgi:hypothetical protein